MQHSLAWLSQSIARSSKETSPSARTARSGSRSSAPRRAGRSSGCTELPAPVRQIPTEAREYRRKGGHPADRHRPARDRIVDAVPVPERLRVHRRPANHRGHAGNRQDGRRRTVRRRSLHAGVCGGDARSRGGRRRRRRRRPRVWRRRDRRRPDGESRDAGGATPPGGEGPDRNRGHHADPIHSSCSGACMRTSTGWSRRLPTVRCWRDRKSRPCSSMTC